MVRFWECFRADWVKLSNLITEARLLLCPLPGILLLMGFWVAAAIVFLIVWATDLLDGYVARKRNEVTELGEILDPIVDKILACFTLVALSIINPLIWWLVAFTSIREILVGWLLIRAKLRGEEVKTNSAGKIKTVVLVINTVLLFLPSSGVLLALTVLATLLMVFFSLISWHEYYKSYSLPKNKRS